MVPDVKTTPDTLFYVGSTTKSFTAASLLAVIEDSKNERRSITTKTKISSILKEDFVLPDAYATAHATIDDALTHRLGFPRHDISYASPGLTLRDTVRSLRHLSFHELRDETRYFNIGYMVLQHVIETATGRWIGDVHKDKIWTPLGMNSTYIRLGDAIESGHDMAYGYSWNPYDLKVVHHGWTDTPMVGGGGIISSTRDFSKYLRAMIDKSLPLPLEVQEQLVKPRVVNGRPPYKHTSTPLYAYGWNIQSYCGYNLVMHDGMISGFTSKLAFLPNQRWGVSIMCNSDQYGFDAIQAVFLRLIESYLRVSADQRQDIVPRAIADQKAAFESYKNGRSRLYPETPNPPVPFPLPLDVCTGTYHNPGYESLSFELLPPSNVLPVAAATKQVLHGNVRRLIDAVVDLEHVSGRDFVAYLNMEETSVFVQLAVRATFRGGNNSPLELGLNLANMAEDDEPLVWFTKVS